MLIHQPLVHKSISRELQAKLHIRKLMHFPADALALKSLCASKSKNLQAEELDGRYS